MTALAALLALALAGGDAPTMARVKETAYARVALAQAIARDAAVRAAVSAQNARAETPEQIRRRDALWVANRKDPLRQALVQSSCSARVRELVKDDGLVVEAFVMDARGAIVCTMAETTDYWQGDEAKWQRTFVDGREAFVDDAAIDASSGTYAIQVSVPVSPEPNKRIGAVTLTLKLRREVAPGR